MKKLFENVRPLTVYWLAVLICYIAYFAADFDFITNLTRNQLATVFFYISAAAGFILIGRITDLKKNKAGYILLAVQLILCPVMYVFNIFGQFAAFGNYIFSEGGAPFQALFHYDRSGIQYLPDFIFSLVFPALFIFIGQKIRAHYK